MHRGRIAATCMAAIGKALGTAGTVGIRPQKIFLRFNADRCLVSIDSSGEHLHRRGYRFARVRAPLRETLAAGCLLACGYDGSLPLVDLMTGSGTFAVEAALIALNRAPGKERDFAFMDWPKYRPGLWRQLLAEAQSEERSGLSQPVVAVDKSDSAIIAARQNLETAGLKGLVQLQCTDFQRFVPGISRGWCFAIRLMANGWAVEMT